MWSTLWSVLAWGGLLVALWRLWEDQRGLPAYSPAVESRTGYRALALSGLAVTWSFMLLLAMQDIAKYPSLAAWSTQSNLFFDAYRRVTETPAAWWWSQQLMLWAPAAVLFFHSESVRQRLPFWHYAWVGMCVAISVALPLFLLRREAQRDAGGQPTAAAWVAVCLMVAASATVLVPLMQDRALQLCLLVLHAGVVLSLLPVAPRASSTTLLRSLYIVLALIAAACWWNVNAQMWLGQADPLRQIGAIVWSDPAQSSISLDLVLTIVICAYWIRRQDGGRVALLFLLGTAALSLGAAFCIHQVWRLRKPR